MLCLAIQLVAIEVVVGLPGFTAAVDACGYSGLCQGSAGKEHQ